MRKVYITLFFALAAYAGFSQSGRRLTWRAGNTTLGTANTFLNASNWSLNGSNSATPQQYDTLYINNASVSFSASQSITGVNNLVIDLGAPGNQTYTLGITSNVTSFTLPASSAISVRSTGRIFIAGSSSRTRQITIGGVVKASNFQINTDRTVMGPSAASAATPTATTGFATGGFIMGTLPVVLVSFDAVKQSNGVALSWKTQQEYNTSFFAIEKSNDGISYSEIARVAAAGNATTPRSYSYTDAAALKGMTYYRVRIVDLDGKTGLTTVKAVRANASSAKVSLYPNPAVSVANIVVDNTESLAFGVNVFNRNGQLVARKNAAAGATAIALEVSSFPAGDYMIDVQFSNGSRQSSKLIVARK